MSTTFTESVIPDDIFAMMEGKSFIDNDKISRDDLRLLTVTHYDFEHRESIGKIVCHKSIAPRLLSVFESLYKIGYEIEKIKLIDYYDADDNRSMRDNNSSSFCFRKVAGTDRLSKHAYGLAIDINPLYNPYIRNGRNTQIVLPPEGRAYADRNTDFPHKLHADDECVSIFKAHGFEWGGDWESVKDYQHFEI